MEMKYPKKEQNIHVLHVLVLILVFKLDKKNYPQVYLEQCKYKVKKRESKSFIGYEIDLDSDYEND